MATVPINDIKPRNEYAATVGQTVFPYTYWITEDADLEVYQNGALLTLTAHYTVSEALNTSGGNVILVTGATVNDVIIISREIPIKRTTEFQTGGNFQASVLNTEQSKEIAILQQLKRDVDRKFGVATASTFSGEASLPDAVASALVGWNSAADGLTNYTTVPFNAPNGATIPAVVAGGEGKLLKVNSNEDGFDYVSLGAAAHVLTSNGAGTAPTFQVAPSPTFKVVASNADTTASAQTFSQTYTDVTGIVASVTPTSDSNKVKVTLSFTLSLTTPATAGQTAGAQFKIFRDTTLVYQTSNAIFISTGTANAEELTMPITLVFLDNPVTSSSTIYKLQARRATSGGTVTITAASANEPRQIILEEI